uniref:Uncharacterized protein n=1 Tax=Setaria italica TaxID=4555 RepID=K3Y429_SETIT
MKSQIKKQKSRSTFHHSSCHKILNRYSDHREKDCRVS